MEKEKTDEVFAKITLHFVESIPSNSFNGIAANRLAGPRIKSSDIKPILKHLVESGSITCTFSNYDGNIHIIRMLGQWLFSIYNFDDPRVAQEIIIDPLREIRRLRQKPAHTTTDDQYDPTFYGARG
ncbi:MAG TPA: hypothetical protein VHX92_06730, partial [Rhizomicrobium sp.]|nr:hypothetical protein [Rhizomicrobium sp.]